MGSVSWVGRLLITLRGAGCLYLMGCSSSRGSTAQTKQQIIIDVLQNRLYQVFKHLDDNDDNELDLEELRAACPNYLRREGLHKQMDSDRSGMIQWNEFSNFMTQLASDDMAAFDDVCVALENRRRFLDIEENKQMLAVLDRLDSHNYQALHRVEMIESCARAIDVIVKPSKCVAGARLINTLTTLQTAPFEKAEFSSLVQLVKQYQSGERLREISLIVSKEQPVSESRQFRSPQSHQPECQPGFALCANENQLPGGVSQDQLSQDELRVQAKKQKRVKQTKRKESD